jgi:uncharacterized membrane protein
VSDLLVIEFPSGAKAEGVREMLLAMQREYRSEPGDAIIAVTDDSGRAKLGHSSNRSLAQRCPLCRGAAC